MVMGLIASAGGVVSVAVGGLYAWATNLYSYNRDAWMTDIQIKQAYEYQYDNLLISTHGMSREEVRDRTQATITKLSNYILVTTLILALAAEILVEGRVPVETADYLLNVYMLCMGTSVLYLVLSILFGIVATNEIYEYSATLLTKTPPPWQAIDADMKNRQHDTLKSEAFEDKPWREIMRPPLWKRFESRVKRLGTKDPDSFDDGSLAEEGRFMDSESEFDIHRHSMTSRASSFMPSRAASMTSSAESIGLAPSSTTASKTPPASGKRSTAEEVSAVVDSTVNANGRSRSQPALRRSSCTKMDTKAATLEEIRHLYASGWERHEEAWKPLETLSFQCLALGVKNLLDVYGYLCMAFLYSNYGGAWAFWAVSFIFTSLNVILMEFLFPNKCLWQTILVGFVPVGFAVAATTPHLLWDRILIPLCYMTHTLIHVSVSRPIGKGGRTYCALTKRVPTFQELAALKGMKDMPKPTEMDVSCSNQSYQSLLCCEKSEGPESEASWDADEDVDKDVEFQQPTFERPYDHLERQASSSKIIEVKKQNHKQVGEKMMAFARFTTVTLWSISVCWSIWIAFYRTESFQNDKALYREEREGPPLAHLQRLPTRWPSPYFRPHSLVCPTTDSVFMADKYRVYERKQDVVVVVDCDADGIIADVSADCDERKCWPIVLLRSNPPKVLDCSTGREYALLKTNREAQQFAVINSTTLLAAHRGEIVQYTWNVKKSGWSPSWVVADFVNEKLEALDVTNNKMLAFRQPGLVELQDLRSGMRCGTWEMPHAVVGAGCAHDNTVLLFVEESNPVKGPIVHLVQAQMNGPEVCKFQAKDPDRSSLRDRFAFPNHMVGKQDTQETKIEKEEDESSLVPTRDDDSPRYGDNWRTARRTVRHIQGN